MINSFIIFVLCRSIPESLPEHSYLAFCLREVFSSYGDKWVSIQLRDRTAKDWDQNPLHFNLWISDNKAVSLTCGGVVDTALICFCTPLRLPASVGKWMSWLFLHRDEPCHFMMENTKQILWLVHYLCVLSFWFSKPDVQAFNEGVYVIVQA